MNRIMMAGSWQNNEDVNNVGINPGIGIGSDSGDVAVESALPKTKKPPLYKVILLNDDYTPMEFVVFILESFFLMDRQKATQIMLTVHTEGSAVCGVYSRDIAESKAAQVEQCALDNQHPLKCEVQAA